MTNSDHHFTDDPLVATIVDSEIFSGSPVLFVAHHSADGQWEFLGGCEDPTPLVVALKNVWAAHPDTYSLRDLPLGWQAWRTTVQDDWVREPIPVD